MEGFFSAILIIAVWFLIVEGLCKIMSWSDTPSSTYKARDDHRRDYHRYEKKSTGRNTGTSKNSRRSEEFEEADSIIDRHGNEHLIDDDGYCEDCDDYHS